MPTLQVGQYFLVGVKWKNPATQEEVYPVGGALPTWTLDKPNVVEVGPSPDNPGLASGRAIRLGDCVLTATAPFDTGFGIQNGTKTTPITVVEVATPEGEIVFSYGEILPMSKP